MEHRPPIMVTRLWDSIRRTPLIGLGLVVTFVVLSWFEPSMHSSDQTVSLLCPAMGLAVGMLFRFGTPWAAAVFLASFLVHVVRQQWPVALGLAAGTTAAVCLTVSLLHRWRFAPRFERAPDLQIFLWAAGLGMAFNALNTAIWLFGAGRIDVAQLLETILLEYLGDLAGVLLLAPLILAWPASHREVPPWRPFAFATLFLLPLCAVLFFGIIPVGHWSIGLIFVPFLATVRLAALHGIWPASVHIALILGSMSYSLYFGGLGPAQLLPAESRIYGAWGYLTALAFASLLTAGVVAERKRAQSLVEGSEANYKALVEDNPALICRFQADGRLSFANETFRRTFAIEFGQTAGADFFLMSGLPDDFQQKLREARASDPSFTAEARRGDRFFRWTARVVQESSGLGVEFHAIGLDVTEEVRADQVRRRIEQQAIQTQKLESVGLLAGGIAHEFNNLLTAILGNVELANHFIPPESEAAPMLDGVRVSAERAARLTQQLLNYSLRNGTERGPLDLSALAQNLQELLAIAVPKRCVFQLDLAEGLPLVEAEESHLRQMLMSLVTNAGEAVNETNGGVTVRTRAVWYDPARDPRWKPRGTLKPGWHVLLQVEDAGPGMGRQLLSRVFEPFFTTKLPGRGLGLAAVLAIVADHRGGVGVCSRLNRGTCVSVLLPALQAATLGPPSDGPHSLACPYCATQDSDCDDTPPEGFPAVPPSCVISSRTGYSSHVHSRGKALKPNECV